MGTITNNAELRARLQASAVEVDRATDALDAARARRGALIIEGLDAGLTAGSVSRLASHGRALVSRASVHWHAARADRWRAPDQALPR